MDLASNRFYRTVLHTPAGIVSRCESNTANDSNSRPIPCLLPEPTSATGIARQSFVRPMANVCLTRMGRLETNPTRDETASASHRFNQQKRFTAFVPLTKLMKTRRLESDEQLPIDNPTDQPLLLLSFVNWPVTAGRIGWRSSQPKAGPACHRSSLSVARIRDAWIVQPACPSLHSPRRVLANAHLGRVPIRNCVHRLLPGIRFRLCQRCV